MKINVNESTMRTIRTFRKMLDNLLNITTENINVTTDLKVQSSFGI